MTNTETLGIWKRQSKQGKDIYLRDQSLFREWRLWANKNEIPAKEKQRIVLLGESVARGYLYDPYYNPASVLNELLKHSSGNDGFEVVDLAKTSQSLFGLVRLCVDALVLNPDHLIFMAGNNWLADLHENISTSHFNEIADRLQQDGIPGVKNYLEQKLVEVIEELFAKLFDPLQKKGARVYIVIPEYNLADWTLSYGGVNLHLPTEQLEKWKQLEQEVYIQRQNSNSRALIELGKALISIDPSHPYGYEVAAAGARQTGDYNRAKEYLQEARDTSIVFRNIGKPRTLGIVQKLLREMAAEHNFTMIDLPMIFEQHNNGALPGRTLFLDYCHLSETGIQMAMASIAQQILLTGEGKNTELNTLLSVAKTITPANRVRAMAHVFAAIHNAHNGQGYEILEYHCRQAVNIDPNIQQFMLLYLYMATRKTPNYLCKEFESILRLTGVDQYDGLLHEVNKKLMDVILVKAMCKALATQDPCIEKYVSTLRISEHGVRAGKPVNLMESYYCSTCFKQEVVNKIGFARERVTVSQFYLVTEKQDGLLLNLVFRVPCARQDAMITVKVNGCELTRCKAGSHWKLLTLRLPEKMLVHDVNIITIHWPVYSRAFRFEREVSLEQLNDAINPIFGEIHSFEARSDRES